MEGTLDILILNFNISFLFLVSGNKELLDNN